MTDVFRQEYKALDDETKDDMKIFKIKAQELWNEFESVSLRENVDKRMMALAKTNLEQAIMWAIKAIT